MENLPLTVVVVAGIALLILVSYSHKAAVDGPDKAAFHILRYAGIGLLGLIFAMVYELGWIN